jgi:hypothetical protein
VPDSATVPAASAMANSLVHLPLEPKFDALDMIFSVSKCRTRGSS